MNSFAIFIFCSILAFTLANPTWYPNNEDEIVKKCVAENPITPEVQEDIKTFADTPTIRALALCRAKGFNVYTEDTGLNSERLAYLFFRSETTDCKKSEVKDCVDKNKDIVNQGQMVYNTIKCIGEKKADMKETC